LRAEGNAVSHFRASLRRQGGEFGGDGVGDVGSAADHHGGGDGIGLGVAAVGDGEGEDHAFAGIDAAIAVSA